MTIDPDDYDLRELRRIADERRGAGRSADEGDRRRSDDDRRRAEDDRAEEGGRRSTRGGGEHRRSRADRRRGGDRDDDRQRREGRRSGRSKSGRGRSRAEDRRRNGRGDDDGRSTDRRGEDDGATIRPRNDVSRPRHGESDHAEGHDEVRRADRIARDLGFGGEDRDRRETESRHSDRRTGGRRRHDEAGRGRAVRDRTDDVGRFQFDTEVRERPRGRAGEALRQNQLEQLLVHETAAAGEGLSKPYLTSLPDEYAAERTVFDWLEFLVLKGGFKRTMDALRYYHTVDWLTEDVEAELQDYLVGFSGEVSNTAEFDVDDHHLSLVYIARLSSME